MFRKPIVWALLCKSNKFFLRIYRKWKINPFEKYKNNEAEKTDFPFNINRFYKIDRILHY